MEKKFYIPISGLGLELYKRDNFYWCFSIIGAPVNDALYNIRMSSGSFSVIDFHTYDGAAGKYKEITPNQDEIDMFKMVRPLSAPIFDLSVEELVAKIYACQLVGNPNFYEYLSE